MRKIILDDSYSAGLPCVATVGFFDGVHLGHRHLIDRVVGEAREAGLQSVVITFDQHPRQVIDTAFKPLLLTSFDEKMERLAQTGIDACVVLPFTRQMAALSAREFMQEVLSRQLAVRCLVTGYDNRFGHNRTEGFDDYVAYGREMGMEVVKASPLVVDDISVSSSVFRRMLADGDVETAARCLGYRYGFTGTVVEGYQQGRKLGFPTANINLDDGRKLLPAPGVYAVLAGVEESSEMRRGVMNIGNRPTFHGDHVSIEVHIFDYQGDLYGRRLKVAVCHRLRQECRFDHPSQLVRQMREDVRLTNVFFDKELES